MFREIGFADELGSGMRNSYKYTKLYSGAEPEFIEGDVFEIIIPLTTGSMTKVGPGTSTVSSGQASGQAGGQVSGQADGQAVIVKLDGQRLMDLLEYCLEPRTRTEMQEFSGISSRDYFRNNVLNPLLETGRITRTIPDKPNSPNQKYRKA